MKCKYMLAIFMLYSAFFMFFIGSSSAALISSFDSGDEGWYLDADTQSAMDYKSSGGNFGGYVEVTDGAGLALLHAPGLFLGDLSSYDGETLSFDSKYFATGDGDPYNDFGVVSLENSTQSLSATLDLVAGDLTDSWTTYSTPLNAGTWSMNNTEWSNLLANITDIYVNLESHDLPDEVVGFDNFTITGTGGAPVPEPGTFILFGTGLLAYARFRKRLPS